MKAEVLSKINLLILISIFLIFLFSIIGTNFVFAAPTANFTDSPNSGQISTTCTSPSGIANLTTNFTAGTNVIITINHIRSTDAGVENIAENRLRLNRGENNIDNNSIAATVEQGDDNLFYTLLSVDRDAPANPVYNVTACSSATVVNVESKIVAINNLTQIAYNRTNNVTLTSTPILFANISTNFTSGNNVIMASITMRNAVAQTEIFAGDINITRNSVLLARNLILINLTTTSTGSVASLLLIANDTNAPANAEYNLTIRDSKDGGTLIAHASLLAFQANYSVANRSNVAIGTTPTVLADVSTTFSANSEVLVIGATQLQDDDTGVENIAVGTYNISEGESSLARASNEYLIRTDGVGTLVGSMIFPSILWYNRSVLANPSFNNTASASAAGYSAWTTLIVIWLNEPPPAAAAEVAPKDCSLPAENNNWSLPCGCRVNRVSINVDYLSVNETGGDLVFDTANVSFRTLNITPSACTIALNGTQTYFWGWRA